MVSDTPSLRLSSDRSVRAHDGGRTLIGGSPARILQLSEAGAHAVRDWFGGTPVPGDRSSRTLADRLLAGGLAHPNWSDNPIPAAHLTVVIPVKDDPPGLQSTVDSIVGLDDPVAAILIVDDGSATPVVADPTWPASVTVIRHDIAQGPAGARNLALGRVATDFVAFVDADVTVPADLLPPVLAHFADDRVVAVAPRVRSTAADTPIARYELHHSPLDLGDEAANVRPRARVSYVPTACLVMRTEAAGFDATLRYGEDVDLVWRLVETGAVVRYEPQTEVSHPPRPTLKAFVKQRFGYASASAPLAQRHPGAVVPVVMSGWSAAAWGLAALGHPVLGVAAAVGSAARLPAKLGGIPNAGRRAAELAGRGHLAAGRQLATAATRYWWPASLVAAVLSRRLRLALVAASIVPPVLDWVKRRPDLDPATYVGLRLVDDAAYGAGLWVSCLRERTVAPLRPDFGPWPERPGRSSQKPAVDGYDRAGDR